MNTKTSTYIGEDGPLGFSFIVLPIGQLLASSLSIFLVLLSLFIVNTSLANDFSPKGDLPERVACPDDSESPVFSNCPTNLSLPYNTGICGALVTWDALIITDNCDPQPTILSASHQSGDLLQEAFTMVSIVAVDSTGNEATCSFEVVITGATGLSLGCPGDVKVTANDTCAAIGMWTAPIIFDNCSTKSNLSSNYSSGDVFSGAQIFVVLYTLTNEFLDTASCTFTVEVEDKTAPLILNCKLDSTIYTKGSGCTAVYGWETPIQMDNCSDVVLLPPTFSPFKSITDPFPLGETTVKYKAIDGGGNIGSCFFKVKVVDTVPPLIMFCPADTTILIAGCDTIVSWMEPVFLDGCDDTPTISQNFLSGSSFNTGIYEIAYAAVDDFSNQRACKFMITIKDNNLPILTDCPNDTTVFVGANCEAIYTYTMPTATDLCSGSITPVANPASTTFGVVNQTVTITAMDFGGNTATCSFVVTSKDTIPPMTNCPASIIINSDGTIVSDSDNIVDHIVASGCEKPIVHFNFPELMDNCSAMITDTMMLIDSFSVGVSNHTYNFKDPYGNAGACAFTVTVNGQQEAITISANLNPVCPDETVTLSSSVTGLGAVFNWTGPAGYTSSAPAPTIENFNFPNVGKYFLTVQMDGCTLEPTDSLFVNMASEITAIDDAFTVFINATDEPLDVTLNDELSSQFANVSITQTALNGEVYEGGAKLFYTPVEGYVGSDQIIYEVCLKDCPTICSAALVTIDVDLGSVGDVCIVPNYLSPNNDGINDELILACLTAVSTDSKMLIFNQWGGLVFEQSPYLNDWRGDLNGVVGQPLPDGTYYYIFHKDKNAEAQKGYITIYR